MTIPKNIIIIPRNMIIIVFANLKYPPSLLGTKFNKRNVILTS